MISEVSNESNILQVKDLNQNLCDCADGLETKTKLTTRPQPSQPKKSVKSTNIDNNHHPVATKLPKQSVQSGNTETKLPFGSARQSASGNVDTHNSNATDADKSVATYLDENKAAELEEDLFRLVDQTIELDYQWNERLNELLESGQDVPVYGVPGVDKSFEGMVAVSSKTGSCIYKRKKKRGRAADDSKGSRKMRRKDNDMDTNEEKQDIVVLGFATCNKCNMIFADADKTLEHEGICNGETVHALADEIMSSLMDSSGGMTPANAYNCNDFSLLTCTGDEQFLGTTGGGIFLALAKAAAEDESKGEQESEGEQKSRAWSSKEDMELVKQVSKHRTRWATILAESTILAKRYDGASSGAYGIYSCLILCDEDIHLLTTKNIYFVSSQNC